MRTRCVQYPGWTEECVGSFVTGVFASCKSLCDCLEPNAGPLKEGKVFLAPKHLFSTKTYQSSISL